MSVRLPYRDKLTISAGRLRRRVAGALALAAALSCGDGTVEPPPPPPPAPPQPTTVTVSPSTPDLTALGTTVQLRVDVRDRNGRIISGAAVTWVSADTSVAVVDESGLVTAAGNGTSTVTGTAGSASGTATVTVAQQVSAVAVTPAADTLLVGDTLRLAAEATDANGHAAEQADLTWASSNAAVGTVDTTGLVRGVGAGAVEITATAGGVAGGAALVVVPLPPATVELTPDTVFLAAPGVTARLMAEVRDRLGRTIEDETVAWASADTLVAVVDSGGLVTAMREGKTTVTATAGSAHGSAAAIVLQSAELVAVAPAVDTIAPRDTLRLAATAYRNGGLVVPAAEFRWSSSDPSVATVDTTGLVRGASDGVATIRATAGATWGTAEIAVVSSERSALQALYYATDGSNWTNSDGWLTDAPLDRWYGVQVNSVGVVVGVTLVRNGLRGRIPPELGALASLVHLRLGWNDLTGPIPPELGRLVRLERLDLRVNGLSGPIPPGLGDLVRLEELRLAWNGLTGPIPAEWGDNLANLDLGSNALSGPVPPGLGDHASLERLYLGGNAFSGAIPPELGNLTNMKYLDLGPNELRGPIPPELGGLASLEFLDLRSNELTGRLPPELGGLASLERLDLRSNELTGPIPPELGNLARLEVLDIRSNQLTGRLPPELGGLASLERLLLQRNALSGPVPPELGRLASAKEMELDANDLSGPVPPGFGQLVFLERLGLASNPRLAGTLPLELAALGRLERLQAGGTGLCAPADPDFTAWLESIPERWVAPCEDLAPPAYVTQPVQSRLFPVPLVAGEEALLRVFVTGDRGASAHIPPVRASFYRDGSEVYVAEIPAGSQSIPAEIVEGDLSMSANARIPAEVVQAGLEVVIDIDPSGTLDLEALGVAPRIPAEGRLGVDVREVPLLDLTVVPFLWTSAPDSTIIGVVADMATNAENAELALTRRILPVADLDVTAHAPVWSTSNNAFTLIRETAAIRALEGGTGHYMGMMSGDPSITGAGGVAHRPGRVSVSGLWEHRGGPSSVIAHELGHNMNLRHGWHENAATDGAVDPSFPYADGTIGAWGYDARKALLLDPSRTRDVMAGGGLEGWISDYHFTKALRHRLEDEAPVASAAVDNASGPGLLLWGGADADGTVFLEPAFVVDAPPLLPDSAGAQRITGYGRDGELFSFSFAMPAVADGDGSSSFAFVVPVQPRWADELVSITLSGSAGSATLDGATDRPVVLLRDSGGGQVRGILRDLPPNVLAEAGAGLAVDRGLEVQISRGLPPWR